MTSPFRIKWPDYNFEADSLTATLEPVIEGFIETMRNMEEDATRQLVIEILEAQGYMVTKNA